ncbi:MAG: hypothetical protein Alpg2KO_23780 [Alphaproteobacteria bacterium]
MSISLDDLMNELMADPEVRDAYNELGPVYDVAEAIITARVAAGLSRAELAETLGTTVDYLEELEAAEKVPTMDIMKRIGKATGTRVKIVLEPLETGDE